MHKHRTIILFGFSILTMMISIASFIFFLRIIENKNKHTAALVATLQEKILYKENAASLNKKIAEVEQTRQTVNSYFVSSSRIDSFVNYLEDLGSAAKTTVKVENFDTTAIASNILSVRLSTVGTFAGVMNTLMILENAPYKVHVNTVSIQEAPQQISSEQTFEKEETATATEIVKEIVKAKAWQATITFTVLIAS